MSDETSSVAADELRQFVERIEQLDAELADVKETRKDALAEAKSRGYCTVTLRMIVKLRKLSKDKIDEQDAIIDLYRSAIGL